MYNVAQQSEHFGNGKKSISTKRALFSCQRAKMVKLLLQTEM